MMFKSFCKYINNTKPYDEDSVVFAFQHSIYNSINKTNRILNNLSLSKMKINILETDNLIQVSIISEFDNEFKQMWKFITDAYCISNKLFIDEKIEKPSFSLAITTKNRQKTDYIIFNSPEVIGYTSSDINKKPDIINMVFAKKNCYYKK